MAVPYDDFKFVNTKCLCVVRPENSEDIHLYTATEEKVSKYDWYDIIDKKTEPIYTKTIKDMESITSVCIGFGVFLFVAGKNVAGQNVVKLLYLTEEGGTDNIDKLDTINNILNSPKKTPTELANIKKKLRSFCEAEYIDDIEDTNIKNYITGLKKTIKKNLDKFKKIMKPNAKIEEERSIQTEFLKIYRPLKEQAFGLIYDLQIVFAEFDDEINNITFSNTNKTLIVQTSEKSYICNIDSDKKTEYKTTCVCAYDNITAVATRKKITLYPGDKEIGTSIESPTTMCVSKNKTFIIGSTEGVTLVSQKGKETKLAIQYKQKEFSYKTGGKINYICISDNNEYLVAMDESKTYIWNTMLYDDARKINKLKRYYYNPYFTNNIPQQIFRVRIITPFIIDKYLITFYSNTLNRWLLDNEFHYAKSKKVYTKQQYATLALSKDYFTPTSRYSVRPLRYKCNNGIVRTIDQQYIGETKNGKPHSNHNFAYPQTYGDENYYYGQWKDGKKHGLGVLKENNVCIHGKWDSGKLVKSISIKCHSNIITTQEKDQKKQISWKIPTTYFLNSSNKYRKWSGKCSFDGDKITILNETPFGNTIIEGEYEERGPFYIISGSNGNSWICSKDNFKCHVALQNPHNVCWFNTAIQILKNLPDINKFMIRTESCMKEEGKEEEEDSRNRVSNVFNIIRVMQSGFLQEKDKNTEPLLYNKETKRTELKTTENFFEPFKAVVDYIDLLNKRGENRNQDTTEFIDKFKIYIEICTGTQMNEYTHSLVVHQQCRTCEYKMATKKRKYLTTLIKLFDQEDARKGVTIDMFHRLERRTVEQIVNDYYSKPQEVFAMCSVCDAETLFSEVTKIMESPILILRISPEFFDTSGIRQDVREFKYSDKIFKNVDFTGKIEVTDTIKIDNTKYELISVGMSSSGHWQSVIKTNGRWISYDGNGGSGIVDEGKKIHEHLTEEDPGFPAVLVYKKIS